MPTANFQHEIDLVSPQNDQGWFSNAGSDEYNDRTGGDCPIKIALYGIQAMNIILQLLDHPNAPLLSMNVRNWMMGSRPRWSLPVPVPGAQVVWKPNLRILEPCTFMSYQYATNQVRAPCMLRPNLGDVELIALYNLKGQPPQTVGLSSNNGVHAPSPMQLAYLHQPVKVSHIINESLKESKDCDICSKLHYLNDVSSCK
jgi:hypothetical protein